ncbi:MAG: DMT family transporter [Pseudomonadota bacterium]|nr:DMT family transporter [Pseudomonadota bacterium]
MHATRIKGLTIAAVGVLFITPDALLVKITSVDPVVFLFWRGLLLALSFLVINSCRYGAGLLDEMKRCGWKGWFCALAFAVSTLGFVVGMKNTAAGNVLVILNTAPVIAALIAWVVWREVLPLRTWVIIVVCVAGATIMAWGEWGRGEPLGMIMAVTAATALAANLNVARSHPDADMSVMLMFGALVLAAIAAGFGGAQLPSARDSFFIGLLCLVFLPVAATLIQIGPRYIPAAEVSMMLLLETVIGAFLVWLVLGEVPTTLSLIGGVIVFSALLAHGWIEVSRFRKARVNG